MSTDNPNDDRPRRLERLADSAERFNDARNLVAGVVIITAFDVFYASPMLTGDFYDPAWLTFAIPTVTTILWTLAAIPVVHQLRRDPHAWRAMRTWRTRRRATAASENLSFPTRPPQPEQHPSEPPAPPTPPR